jgi:uncharacterized membrane protein YdjX (TVP38/TMEM64 family)
MTTAQPASIKTTLPRGLTFGVGAAILVFVLAMVLFGRDALGLDQSSLRALLEGVRSSVWSYPAVVLLFVGLALIGFPQALLFAATTAVFGAWLGGAFAWTATLVSGFVTFRLGRTFGRSWVTKISARRLRDLLDLMRRRGLVASMLVRWLPSGPFIVVNMLCGAVGMPAWKFLGGLALGTLPKLAVIAFFTEQAAEIVALLRAGDPRAIGLLMAMGAVWIGLIWLLRVAGRRLRGKVAQAPHSSPASKPAELGLINANGEPGLNLKSKAS